MSRRKPNFKTKSKEKDQFAVDQPMMTDTLDDLQTRSGRSYARASAASPETKESLFEKEVKELLKIRTTLSSPNRTTSTEAMDIEEGQEMTRFIQKEALARERKATLRSYRKTPEVVYDLPRPLSIPIPDSRQRQEEWETVRPCSVQLDTMPPDYDEICLLYTSPSPRD